ncbi:BrnA antitoxin family protein [Leptolyngbya sp. 15MV]|jgi:uncharacterized protein (DUF4415 family)|nr:BrnA antitoxin family protein [Leptolyngbya sp. 15MV]
MKKPGDVKFALDPGAPLTEPQRRELAALAARPDETIDFSDIPPLGESFWRDARPSPFRRPAQQQLTVRLDADVLAWLKSGGRGYQSRLNRILREAMLRAAKRG